MATNQTGFQTPAFGTGNAMGSRDLSGFGQTPKIDAATNMPIPKWKTKRRKGRNEAEQLPSPDMQMPQRAPMLTPGFGVNIPQNINLPFGASLQTPGVSMSVPGFPVPQWAQQGMSNLQLVNNRGSNLISEAQTLPGSMMSAAAQAAWRNRGVLNQSIPYSTPQRTIGAGGFGVTIPAINAQLNPFFTPPVKGSAADLSKRPAKIQGGTTRRVQVRTGEGTSQEIPWQPGMNTGTFFSGGGQQPQALPTYPTGTFFAAGGNMVRGPGPTYPTTTTTTNDNPFSSYYKGYGGGGGGGYTRTPSWLQNLYNWNFKK